MFELEITHSAYGDLSHFKKFEQRLIVDEIEKQLLAESLALTRNKKSLRPNDLSEWELRIDKYRVFYDVDVKRRIVTVKAVGWKERNRLLIRGQEYAL